MYFENTGLEDIRVDFGLLNDIMSKHGLTKEGQWDYERVTFDRKFDVHEGRYYLRVFGYAVEGDIDAGDATVNVMKPVLGKYYYPFGVEYGEDEHFPEHLTKTCADILKTIKSELKAFEIQA